MKRSLIRRILWGLLPLMACQATEQDRWLNLYVGQNQLSISNIDPTPDGGVIAVGMEYFFVDDGPISTRLDTPWLTRLDKEGNVLWHHRWLGPAEAMITIDAVRATGDGGYLVVGSYGAAAWIARMGADGRPRWQYVYDFPERPPHPSSGTLRPFSVLDLGADLYAVGMIYRKDEQQGFRFLLLQLRGDGTIVDQIHYWVPGFDFYPSSLQTTADDGFVVSGTIRPETVISTSDDAWALKLDRYGEVAWAMKLGDSRWYDEIKVRETPAGGYVGVGSTIGNLPWPPQYPPTLSWVVRISPDGRIQWQKAYGDTGKGEYFDIHPLADGGYLLAGGRQREPGFEQSETWLLELNPTGEVRRRFVLPLPGPAFRLVQAADGNRFILGFGTDLPDDNGFWMAKTAEDGTVPDCFVKGKQEGPAEVTVRPVTLGIEPLAVETDREPLVTRTAIHLALELETSPLATLPFCPAGRAYRSCSQIQAAGQSYGSGPYPVLLPSPGGDDPEVLSVHCEMEAYGGGWMLIASHFSLDPWPPSRFVRERFGDYPTNFSFDAPPFTSLHSHSFSIWPAIDWSATTGTIGIVWKDPASSAPQSALLEDFTAEELQKLLATSFWVDVWVR